MLGIFVNAGSVVILMLQCFYMAKLCHNHFLDGTILTKFYHSYFLFLGFSLLGLTFIHFNDWLQSAFLVFMVIVDLAFALYVLTHPEEEVSNLDLITESDFLLVSARPSPNDSRTQIKSIEVLTSLSMNDEIDSLKETVRTWKQKSPKKQIPTRRTSFSRPPIMAALLGANGALAGNSSQQLGSINIWMATLITLSLLSFVLSQVVYHVSIFKTNLFLPIRHQSAMFSSMALLSAILIYVNGAQANAVFINIPIIPRALNLLVPLFTFILSLVSLSLQIYLYFKGDNDTTFSSVTVYDSIGSPLMMV